MVDEYQDTNGVQFRLVSLLAARHRNLCVVGDDDQSIYRFRGADIRNILDFESVYPDAKVIRLEQNYRSTKNILAAANEVIRNNRKRKVKKLWTDNDDGELIQHIVNNNEKEEAGFITGTINDGLKEGRDYCDFAILYRTNAQSRVLEEKLFREGIPYRLVGGVSFYQRKEIKDILAYLKIIENGTDAIAVKRIINVPKRGIGNTTVERIQEYAELYGMSFLDAVFDVTEIPNINRGRRNVEEFALMIDEFKKVAASGNLVELMNQVLTKTEYIKALELENTPEANDRIDNIKELTSKLKDYVDQAKDEASLAGFLEDVALIGGIDEVSEDDNKVILMTLHSAKGLEFPVVFMAGMEDGLFPSYMSLNSGLEEDIEEERRLCYVGITRAKEELFITSARQRMLHGNTQYNQTSRFLSEIPSDLIKSDGGISFTKTQENIGASYSRKRNDFFNSKPYTVTKPVAASSIPSPSGKTLDYDEGDLVKHPKYGIGQVRAIEAGGADFQVTVNFPSHGVKKLIASFAGLKKI